MALAASDEIFVSDLTRALAVGSGLKLEDRGMHALRGFDGEWQLYLYVENPAPA